MKLIKYFFLFLILSGSMVSYAQYENTSGTKQQEKKPQEKRQALKKEPRWFAGGMLGLGGGSTNTYTEWYIELAPLLGYKITPDFHVGTRITYIFNSVNYKANVNLPDINLHHYGGSVFARYVFLRFLMAHAEYEVISFDSDVYDRIWYNNLYLGGGYYQSVGGNAFVSFLVLFNVLDNEYAPFGFPIFRFGFGFGF